MVTGSVAAQKSTEIPCWLLGGLGFFTMALWLLISADPGPARRGRGGVTALTYDGRSRRPARCRSRLGVKNTQSRMGRWT